MSDSLFCLNSITCLFHTELLYLAVLLDPAWTPQPANSIWTSLPTDLREPPLLPDIPSTSSLPELNQFSLKSVPVPILSCWSLESRNWAYILYCLLQNLHWPGQPAGCPALPEWILLAPPSPPPTQSGLLSPHPEDDFLCSRNTTGVSREIFAKIPPKPTSQLFHYDRISKILFLSSCFNPAFNSTMLSW